MRDLLKKIVFSLEQELTKDPILTKEFHRVEPAESSRDLESIRTSPTRSREPSKEIALPNLLNISSPRSITALKKTKLIQKRLNFILNSLSEHNSKISTSLNREIAEKDKKSRIWEIW